MTERSPLSQTTSDPFERALLLSVQRDNPGPQALQRTAAALGVGAAAFTGVGAATGAVVGSTPVAAVSLKLVALKAIVVGAMCGVVAITGQRVVKSFSTQAAAPVQHVAPSARDRSASAVGAPPAVASEITQAPRELPQNALEPATEPLRKTLEPKRVPSAVEGAPSARQRRDAASTTIELPEPPNQVGEGQAKSEPAAGMSETALRQAAVSSVGEEIACVDRARQAIRENRGQAALLELGRYQTRWPNGVFSMECAILRVEAQLALGNRSAAERDANAILAKHPNHRYAARLRAMFGQGKGPTEEK